LCYLYNFENPRKPVALRLPAGTAARLRGDLAELVSDLRSALPSLFESEDYRNRRQVIEDEFKNRQEAAFEQLQERGKIGETIDTSIRSIRRGSGHGTSG
ncbi:MAG: Lon-like protease helical domain-containing protein, partial [Dongiaceae bacterium]